MFACTQSLQGLWIMQEWRRRDVNEVQARHPQQSVHLHNIGQAEAAHGRVCRLAMGTGHSHQPDSRNLREMLQSEQAESAATNNANSNLTRFRALRCGRISR